MFKAIRRHWLPIVMVLMVTVGWNITYTPTGSMEPTIKTWHIYRCVRWPFAPEPERGDIIMYRDGWRVYPCGEPQHHQPVLQLFRSQL